MSDARIPLATYRLPFWADTAIELPPDSRGRRPPVFADALTGARIDAEERDGRFTIPAAAALEHFPVALLAAV